LANLGHNHLHGNIGGQHDTLKSVMLRCELDRAYRE